MAHNGSLKVQNSRTIGCDDICYVRFMLNTQIQQDTRTGSVTLNPRRLKIPSAVKYAVFLVLGSMNGSHKGELNRSAGRRAMALCVEFAS